MPEADKPTTISARANLVNLPVVVRDNKGRLVQTLGKEDFALTVDGAPATIRYFDKDQNVRLTLGLLVDTSGSMRANLDQERVASGSFLDKMLGKASPDGPDRAFIIQFGHETELLADLTESKPKLQAGLKEIDGNSGSGAQTDPPADPQDQNNNGNGQDRRHGGNGRGGGSGGGGTVLYDAVYLSGDEIMSKQHGRKALIILSDGDDRGSKKTLAKAIEAAQRADTVIYAIYLKGQEGGGGRGFGGGGFPGGGGGGRHGGGGGGGNGGGGGGYPGGGGGGESRVDGKKVLQRMADETGGRLFEVKGKQTVDAIYGEIAEELRAQYRIGYTPTAETAAEGYHKLALGLTSATYKKDVVQTRDGYYTGADAAVTK